MSLGIMEVRFVAEPDLVEVECTRAQYEGLAEAFESSRYGRRWFRRRRHVGRIDGGFFRVDFGRVLCMDFNEAAQ